MTGFRSSRALLLVLLAAFPASADLVKYKEWTKSPEYVYLATQDERKAWEAVATDERAEEFLALFWARRNPDLKNPANEFKMTFDARVAKADELFKLGSRRGALTERGKLFILVGPPKTMAKKRLSLDDAPTTQESGAARALLGLGAGMVTDLFHYDRPQLPPWSDVPSLNAKFQVNESASIEEVIDITAARRLESMAVTKALVNLQLKEPPVYEFRADKDAEAKAATPATTPASPRKE